MSAIRNAAKGEQCTLNIAGVCNYNPETVVFCHFPSETHGMGLKSDDLSGGFGCSSCHDVIDGRSHIRLSREDKEFYMRRSQFRTMRRLWRIYGEMADKAWVNGRRYSAETWHEYCKGVLLGFDIKAMPDGTEVKTPISTTTLNTAEMTDYQNRLQSWAAGEFGIIWEF